MIIKASLHTLRQGDPGEAVVREAVADIDDEVTRLNRIVNDVLDFARPIRFDFAPADVNALCADVADATRAGHEDMRVTIERDPALGAVMTDAERLRTALVNILTNARHAVAARSAVPVAQTSSVAQGFLSAEASAKADSPASVPDITITTRRAPKAFAITVRDRGVGVKPDDLTRVFDPYFTTKRTGSGLGLAIAKNIIEGMGGTITLESRPDEGTEIRIDLPEAQA
jgi:signal transduction histidine kinase